MLRDLLFLRGRVGRLDFIAIDVAASGGWFLGLLVLNLAFDESTAATVATAVLLPVGWILLGNTIRRLHDLDKPAALLLLGFLPIIGLGLALYLIFTPGGLSFNRHGQPPARTVMVRPSKNRHPVNVG